VIIKFCLVFPKMFLLHKVVRDAKKVEKHCSKIIEPLLKREVNKETFYHCDHTIRFIFIALLYAVFVLF